MVIYDINATSFTTLLTNVRNVTHPWGRYIMTLFTETCCLAVYLLQTAVSVSKFLL